MKVSRKNEKTLFISLFLFRPFLKKRFVVKHHVRAQQVFQATRESLDPRAQQVLRDHQGIVDLKDPSVHKGTRVMKAPVANPVSQVLKELRDSRDQPVLEEAEAKRALEEVQGPQYRKELMVC